jgi:hypothetical protein
MKQERKMTSLYDIANEIQVRNDQIAKLEDENDEQISILWDELFRKLKSAGKLPTTWTVWHGPEVGAFIGQQYVTNKSAIPRRMLPSTFMGLYTDQKRLAPSSCY